MNDLTLRIHVWLRTVMACEEAQDLVEYSLLIALLALGSTVGMRLLATEIGRAFQGIAFSLRHYTSPWRDR